MYRTSQELISILEKNGLRNKSYLYVDEYGKSYSSSNGFYEPNKHKRVFGFGHGERRLNFNLDRLTFYVSDAGSLITEQYYEIDESKLRSILSYFKCSYHKQQTLRTHCNNRIEFAGEKMRKQRQHGYTAEPFDDKFEKIYNEIEL